MPTMFRNPRSASISRVCALVLGLSVLTLALPARADGLLDVVDVVGARDNQLVGYGVVTGLTGTGDDVMAPFAAQSLRALLSRLGVQVGDQQLYLRDVAAVVVTATIPPFARQGSKLDVTVSAIGNARSLQGGVLVQTPLRGADRRVYAVAQGALVLGGFAATGSSGSSVARNMTTTGRIPSGALVEKEIATRFTEHGTIVLSLRRPDFVTAQRIAEAVDKAFGQGSAQALDGGAVSVKLPAELAKRPVAALAKLGGIDVTPSNPARVVINERTGTVVAGGDVKLSPVAIAQGGITIAVHETAEVSQPGPMSAGHTQVTHGSDVQADESTPSFRFVNAAATLADVAQALSTFGVSPRELASILQALSAAGALHAEIIVQ